MKIVLSSNRRAVGELLSATRVRDRATELAATKIVDRVRRRGDPALKDYAKHFDGVTGALEVKRPVWERETRALSPEVRRAIARAARNVRNVRPRRRSTDAGPTSDGS